MGHEGLGENAAVTRQSKSNLIIGLLCIALALFAIFVWIPLDTDTGLLEKVRRRIKIGDALFPTVAAGFIAFGGLLLVLFERKAPNQPALRLRDLVFIASALALLLIGFGIMRYAGPVAVALFQGDAEYRLLRDTAPWKHIGFLMGGVVIIAGLISLAEGRFRPKVLGIAIAVVLAMIAVYDLPFDDLLLPPNGDV
jgi:hypothetical protein